MLSFQSHSASKHPECRPTIEFHCVEFTLDAPHPIYQFKIRRTDDNFFFLIKNDSDLLQKLKKDEILPMKYISSNGVSHFEICDTQITNIINEVDGRFEGHHRIELAVIPQQAAEVVH